MPQRQALCQGSRLAEKKATEAASRTCNMMPAITAGRAGDEISSAVSNFSQRRSTEESHFARNPWLRVF